MNRSVNPQESTVIGLQIMEAFSRSSGKWRSPGGIARDTGLSVNEVTMYINNHPEKFEQSSYKLAGSSLYSLEFSHSRVVGRVSKLDKSVEM